MTERKKKGRPISDNPKNKRLEIRLTIDELARLEKVAKRYRTTKTDVINKGIELLDNLDK